MFCFNQATRKYGYSIQDVFYWIQQKFSVPYENIIFDRYNPAHTFVRFTVYPATEEQLASCKNIWESCSGDMLRRYSAFIKYNLTAPAILTRDCQTTFQSVTGSDDASRARDIFGFRIHRTPGGMCSAS